MRRGTRQEVPTTGVWSALQSHGDDWDDHTSDGVAYCPKCGAKDDRDEFLTPEQGAYIEQYAREYVSNHLNQALTRAAGRTMLGRSHRVYSLTMSVSHRARPMVFPLPLLLTMSFGRTFSATVVGVDGPLSVRLFLPRL